MVEDVVRSLGLLTLGTRMRRIGERLQADAHKVLSGRGFDIQASQWPYLAAVDRLGPLTIGDLAEAVGISQPGATRALAQLVEAGLLTADPSPDDQRRRIVSLTRQGRKMVDAAKREVWPLVEAAVRDLCGGLRGPLLEQLAAIEDGLIAASLERRLPKAGGTK